MAPPLRPNLVAVAALLVASPSLAATWSAGCPGCDYPDVADAIAKAPSGSVLDIYPGTYKLGKQLFSKDLTLHAKRGGVIFQPSDPLLLDVGVGGSSVSVTLDGQFELDGDVSHEVRLASVHDGATLTLRGVKLYDSDVRGDLGPLDAGGQGIMVNGATLNAIASTFTRLSGTGRSGGAISAQNKATVTLTDCSFVDNDAKLGGAVAAWSGSTLLLSGSNSFKLNEARSGGAIHIDSASITTRGGTFLDNDATVSGGAIALVRSTADIHSATFRGNVATDGGAIDSAGSGTLIVASSTFERNAASKRGGHVHARDGATTTLSATTLRDGAADLGGSISTHLSDLTLSSVKQYDNVATAGGHVHAEGKLGARSKLTVNRALFGARGVISGGGLPDGAKATVFHLGGGIYGSHVDFTMHFTDVSDAVAWAGGGVYVADSSVYVTNSTLQRNDASGDKASGIGGGLASLRAIGAVKIWSSDLAENTAVGPGGAIATAGGGSPDLRSSSLASNSSLASGGAVYAQDHLANVVMIDSVFSLNEAWDGGGAVSAVRSPVWIRGDGTSTLFKDNAVTGPAVGAGHGTTGATLAGRGGGALRIWDGRTWATTSYISGASFVGNSAPDHGGALQIDGQRIFTMLSTKLEANEAGAHGGGAYLNSVRDINLDKSVIDGNIADMDGGGMAVRGETRLDATNFTVQDNEAGADGGGLWLRAASAGVLTLDAKQAWKRNTAGDNGGGLYVEGYDQVLVPAPSLEAWQNVAGGRGGAIAAVEVATDLSLAGGHVWANKATNGGGVWSDGPATSVQLGSVDFESNVATDRGGGLRVSGGSLELAGTVLRTNEARHGAGLDASECASVRLVAAQVKYNLASGTGGGVRVAASPLVIDDKTTFEGNKATLGGGGLSAIQGTDAVLDGTHFTANSGGLGGAIGLEESDLSLRAAVLDNNTGSAGGGAVYAESSAELQIVGSSLTGNAAPVGGALRLVAVDVATLHDTTFESNVANAIADARGGAISADQVRSLRVTQSSFVADAADDGGSAIYAMDSEEVRLVRNVVCGASSETGRAVELHGGDGGAWIANNVMDGRGSVRGRLLSVHDRAADIVHNHLIGSQDTAIFLQGWTGTVSDNLLLDHAADAAMVVPGSTDPHQLAYNAFFATGPSVGDAFVSDLQGAVLDDPRLVAWPVPPAEPCPPPRYHPRPDSPLVGAGNPVFPDLGPDGLPREDGHSTVGAFGGPDADPSLFLDEDLDGVPAILDCDDSDPTQTDGAFLWPDDDGDGLGDRSVPPSYECSGQAGWVDNGRDCDDSDKSLGEGTELWPDRDGDGLGDRNATAGYACVRSGWVDNDLDCDDQVTHVGSGMSIWPDADGDGFGDRSSTPGKNCTVPDGWVRNDLDCNDNDAEQITRCAPVWYGRGCNSSGGSPWLAALLMILVVRRRPHRAAEAAELG